MFEMLMYFDLMLCLLFWAWILGVGNHDHLFPLPCQQEGASPQIKMVLPGRAGEEESSYVLCQDLWLLIQWDTFQLFQDSREQVFFAKV